MQVDPELNNLVQRVAGFLTWNHADKIRLFAWFLHAVKRQDRFTGTDIGKCYEALDLEKPTSISPFLAEMGKRNPKELLRDTGGWFMERRVREQHDEKYGVREITVQVTKLLEDLPDKVPDLTEKDFLKEAIICYRHGAFRAAIVMCWSLAFWHLCQFILKHHLSTFNATYPIRFKGKYDKAKAPTIRKYEDFSVDLQESEVIEICKSALITTNDVYKILSNKLGIRNSAAHPSTVQISQLKAEDFIEDLVTNVILALKI